MKPPTEESLTATKHVMRYLQKTKHFGILYDGDELLNDLGEVRLSAACDADFAGDTVGRKSTTGYVLLIAGGPVAWKSQRQRIVALSSVESEYCSVSQCGREIEFTLQLLTNLNVKVALPVPVMIDATGAEAIANSRRLSARTKHLDVRLHHIRQMIELGKIKLIHVSSADNPADVLTKPLARTLFSKHADTLVSEFK